MKSKDFPCSIEARKVVEKQLEFYNMMMADKVKKEDKMTKPKQKTWPDPESCKRKFTDEQLSDSVKEMKVPAPKKKLYIVDTISTFRHRYVIEANELEHAYDEVTMVDSGNDEDSFESVSQRYLGEVIIDGREITKKDFDKMLAEMAEDKNEGCSHWMGDKLIRVIDYGR